MLARLQYWSMMVQKDEDKLLKRLLNASDRERNSAKKKQAAELKKAEKRKAEVDGLFAKMYEDWSARRITEYNFNMLSEKYQNEQKELETKIRQLHETMEACLLYTSIQQIMGISRASAFELVHTPGFPAFRSGRLIKVSKTAFFEWMAKGSETVPRSDKKA